MTPIGPRPALDPITLLILCSECFPFNIILTTSFQKPQGRNVFLQALLPSVITLNLLLSPVTVTHKVACFIVTCLKVKQQRCPSGISVSDTLPSSHSLFSYSASRSLFCPCDQQFVCEFTSSHYQNISRITWWNTENMLLNVTDVLTYCVTKCNHVSYVWIKDRTLKEVCRHRARQH